MDAAVLHIYEQRWREPPMRSGKWLDHQAGQGDARRSRRWKRARRRLGATDIGAIALACALGYLDLRFEGAWRTDHPRLVAWLDAFAAGVPAFEATRFRG